YTVNTAVILIIWRVLYFYFLVVCLFITASTK
ncbi:Threonine efflux protein, partial [Haemophilus influenzae]